MDLIRAAKGVTQRRVKEERARRPTPPRTSVKGAYRTVRFIVALVGETGALPTRLVLTLFKRCFNSV